MGVPLCVWMLHYCTGKIATAAEQEQNLRSLVCIYGYSFMPLLPASMLMVIPGDWWKTLIAFLSCVVSCVFVRNQLWSDMSIDDKKLRYAMVVLLFGTHATVNIIYRFKFFEPNTLTA